MGDIEHYPSKSLQSRIESEHKIFNISTKLLLRIYHYATILNMSQYSFGNDNLKLQYPGILIHIPKTGGQSLESELHSKGINVGRNSFGHNYNFDKAIKISHVTTSRIYPIKIEMDPSKIYEPSICSFWHMPPSEYVHNSIVIVRNPVARLLSAYCHQFRLKIQHRFFELYTNSSKTFPDCDDLNIYIKFMYHQYHQKNNKYWDDCHSLPQWEYAQYASKIIAFKDIDKDDFWETVSKHFGLEPHALHSRKTQSTSCPFPNLSRYVNMSCLTPYTRRLVMTHFEKDYKHLYQYF
mmetsp:Transcript_12250/g.12334  ORF Transcript_12250/g.12334 Transcript_12250/m.12334 type:complete len:294 (-) Transcript_12250:30-911(-)